MYKTSARAALAPASARARARALSHLMLSLILSVSFSATCPHLTPLARAEERESEGGDPHGGGEWRHAHLIAARANPPGLVSDSAMGYSLPLRHLYGAEEAHPLLGPTRALLGLNALLTPQNVQLGPLLRATPLTVLELQLSARYILPLNGVARARRSQVSDAATLAAITPARGGADSILTQGWRLNAQARLQMKVGRVAARSAHMLRADSLSPHGSTGTFYDQTLDVTTPFDGLTYQAESEALYVSPDERLIAGLRHTYAAPLGAGSEPLSRLGPLVVWGIGEAGTNKSDKSDKSARKGLVLLSQWHLRHHSRAGQLVSAWVPYIAVGCVIEGVL